MTDAASHKLDPLLRPEAVALVGASPRPESYGARVLGSLVSGGYEGAVHLINPGHSEIGGRVCHPDFASLPSVPEHAVLTVRNEGVEAAMRAAVEAGARAVTLYGTLMLEDGGAIPLKERVQGLAREAGVQVCGGNGMGFYNRESRVCLQLGQVAPSEPCGDVAYIAQSGSALTALSRHQSRVRFNLTVSPGQELTTTTADYMDFALSRPSTRAICLFLETVRDPERFVAALDAAADRGTPVVVCKVGRSARARAFALTHTGALAGDDRAFDAICERHGAIRVADLDEMVATLQLLTMPKRAAATGGLVAMLDSGGERELLADVAEDCGVRFPPLSAETRARLAGHLEDGFDAENPLDAWGAGREIERHLGGCLDALLSDRNAALGLWIADLSDAYWLHRTYARIARDAAARTSTPLAFAACYAQTADAAISAELSAAGVPVLKGLRPAIRAAAAALRWRDFAARRAAAPPAPASFDETAADAWRRRLASADPLDEDAGAALLDAFGVPTPRRRIATSAAEAAAAATEIGFPVVLKTAQHDIAHKSDVGGVALDLRTPEAVASAYDDMARRLGPRALVAEMVPPGVEIMMGVFRDPQFGPIVLVGAGGVLVETLSDVACAAPPFDAETARALLDRLRLRPLLDGVRGRPAVAVDALAETLARLSVMAAALGDALEAVDVNPLVVGETGAVAVDALVVGRRPPEGPGAHSGVGGDGDMA